MTTDTKWIIGTIVPAVLVVAGLLSAQISGVDSSLNARIDDMNGRIGDLNGRLERLETDVRSMDDRLRAVEVAFGKVDQRLETLERVLLPTAMSGNRDPGRLPVFALDSGHRSFGRRPITPVTVTGAAGYGARLTDHQNHGVWWYRV